MATYVYFAKFLDENNNEFTHKLQATNTIDATVQATNLANAYGWKLCTTFEDII